MSLLDSSPHTVEVFLEEEVVGFRGSVIKQPSATSVQVRGSMMQTLASTRGAFSARQVDEGQDVSVAYRFITREAPVGWWSRVEWDDPNTGVRRKFAVLGGPQLRDFSVGTRHLTVTLTEIR